MCVCVCIGLKGKVDTQKQIIHSYTKFYEKDNQLNEIYFLVCLGGFNKANAPGENGNTSDFDENKNITPKH